MSRKSTEIITLALGVAVLLSLTLGADKDHRPPAGARKAIELVTRKPGGVPVPM